MKDFRSAIALSSCVFLALCLMFAFRKVPASPLWRGYDAFYIDSSVPEEDVLGRLEGAGCGGIICMGSQKVPEGSGILPALLSERAGDYLEKRNMYFSDKENSYSIYYVPSEQRSRAVSAARALISEHKADGGFDSGSGFPWICPVLVLAVSLALALFSDARLEFLSSAAIACAYAACFPFYVCAAAAIFLLFPLFVAQKVLYRKKLFSALARSRVVMAFALLPLPFVFAQDVLGGVFFAVAAACCCASFRIQRVLRERADSLRGFAPVFILNADMVRLVPRSQKKYMLVPAMASLAALAFCMGGGIGIAGGSPSVLLPAPSQKASDVSAGLPLFDDYVAWRYNMASLPYRRLDSKEALWSRPREGDRVTVTRYSQRGDGSIESREEVVMSYGRKFFDETAEAVEGMDYPAMEKLLLANAGAKDSAYSPPGRTAASTKSVVLLLVLAAVPATIYLFGRKNEIS